MVLKKIWLLTIFSMWGIWSIAQTVNINLTKPNGFTYTLSNDRIISAGAFNSNGQLIRTIFTNVKKLKGTHKDYWDGKDDAGNSVTGSYTIKVLSDSLTYQWQNTIGNTSDSSAVGGHTIWKGFYPNSSMVEVGSTIYACDQYSEGNSAQRKFAEAHPQQMTVLPVQPLSTGQSTIFVCTDGTRNYWIGSDFRIAQTFCFASLVSNDSEVTFSSGTVMTPYIGRTYNAIDLYNSGSTAINAALTHVQTGAAVQVTGNKLFIAHGALNYISVVNKTTGAGINTDALTGVQQIFLEDDNTLWACLATSVNRYTVNSDGSLTSATLSITGFQRPAALAVKSGVVYVTDGGTNQYIKTYNSSTGAFITSHLTPGGYSSSPDVTNYKIYIEDQRQKLRTYILPLSDGTFWVGDPGNMRNLHYDASWNYLEQIMYQQRFYSCNIALHDSTRVFADTREFSFDYNGNWALIKNWGYNLPVLLNGYTIDNLIYFYRVIKISNGHTYGEVHNTNPGGKDYYFFELTSSGLRQSTKFPTGAVLWPDGSLITTANSGSSKVVSQRGPPTFDGSFNPVYGSPTTLTTFALGTSIAAIQPLHQSLTTSGKLIMFNNTRTASQGTYHLAGWDVAHNRYGFQTYTGSFSAYNGTYFTDNKFDEGNLVQQPGGEFRVVGNYIITSYKGEFWKNGETNYFNIWDESGLMIGLFGTNRYITDYSPAYPGSAGNCFAPQVVKIGSNMFVLHNDESIHAGIHVWKISGLNTIAIQSTPLTVNTRVFTPPTNHRVDLLFGNAEGVPLVNGVGGWSRSPATDFNISSAIYLTTLVRKSQGDMSKSADIYIKSANVASPTTVQTFTRQFPTRTHATSSWEFSGEIGLDKSPFTADAGTPTSSTGARFYATLQDSLHKNIAIFNFVAGGGGILNINTTNILTGFPNQVNYQPMQFQLKRSGSNVYMLCVINGKTYTSTQALYDGTADITRPYYFTVHLQFNNAINNNNRGFGLDLISLWFNYN